MHEQHVLPRSIHVPHLFPQLGVGIQRGNGQHPLGAGKREVEKLNVRVDSALCNPPVKQNRPTSKIGRLHGVLVCWKYLTGIPVRLLVLFLAESDVLLSPCRCLSAKFGSARGVQQESWLISTH